MSYSQSNETWGWPGESDYFVQKDATHGIPQQSWNRVMEKKEDLSYMFDDTTPVKACVDIPYHDDMEKELEGSSQVKRRRMLQFSNEPVDPLFLDDDISSSFLRSRERIDSLEEVLNDVSQWEASFDELSPVDLEGLEQSESWLAECLMLDSDAQFSSDNMTSSGTSDGQVDATAIGACNLQTGCSSNVVNQQTVRTSRTLVLKGRKSYMRTPTKPAAAVAYPFAFVKPCGVNGDVTLKDINQRILAPPPSKAKQAIDDPAAAYPTSAITGKPVVGKTTIRTEGGQGSITIMRTRG